MNEEIDLEEFAPWLLIFMTLIGGWLRIFLLGSKGMWLDETFSVWVANHSVGDMLAHRQPIFGISACLAYIGAG